MSENTRVWTVRAGLVIGSLMVAVLAIELVIRVANVSVAGVHINRKTIVLDPNPDLRFRLRPGSVAHAEVDYRINALGLRSPETSEAKPANTRRIIVSGDSIPFGYWVAAEDGFAQQLQVLANMHRGSGDAVEVVNLGVPGYNLDQSFAMLHQRGFRFRPDLVVVSVCLNDLESVFSYEYGLAIENAKQRNSNRWWIRLRSAVLDHSMFAAWFEYRMTRLALRRSWATQLPRTEADSKAGDPTAIAVRAAHRAARKLEQREALSRTFGAFEKLLRANGNVPGLVVLFPGIDYEYAAYPHREFHELVADTAAATGLPFLDLLDCYSAYSARDLGVDPVHPSPIGHRVAAHAILDAIAARALLPGGGFDLSRAGDCKSYRIEDFPTVRGY